MDTTENTTVNAEPEQKISVGKKFTFGVGEIGQQFTVTMFSTFLLFYLTTYAGFNPATVGTMMLLARIWDAVNDPIMGGIIDRTHSRWGKARPYIIFCALPCAVFFVMNFFIPVSGQGARLVWLYVAYIGQGMLYTATGISYTTMISRISSNPMARVDFNRYRIICSMVVMILAPTITPIIAAQLAGPEENFTYAYAVIALIYGLIMMACYLVVGIFVKETVKDPAGPVQRTPLKETLSALFKNTHFLLILATTFLYVVSVVLSSSVVLYFILYRMNAPELQSVLLFVSTLPTVASIFIVKPMIKKWGKRVTGMIGVSMGILGTVVRFLFIDGVLGMYIAGSCLAGLGMGLFSALMIPLLLDTVEYGEWKFGIRNEGMIVAANSFGYKLAMGVGPAVVGFALQASGYIAGAATQNQSTLNMLTVLSIAAPIVCYIAIVILLKFSKTEGMMPTIYKELALKRAAAGSAQAIKAD